MHPRDAKAHYLVWIIDEGIMVILNSSSLLLRVLAHIKNITMWKLSSSFPILQNARDTLPHPRPGILTGFGCPTCYKTSTNNKKPLEYTKRDGLPHLIGLRVIFFLDLDWF
jgi:hypothetical protein